MHKSNWLGISGILGITLIVSYMFYKDQQGSSLPQGAFVPYVVPSHLNLPLLDHPEKKLDLNHYKGQMVLVHFFASWCGHCRAEHALMVEMARLSSVKIIGVGVKDNRQELKEWLLKSENPYAQVGLDFEAHESKTWSVTGTPTSFLINGDGKVVYQQHGKITLQALAQIKSLLNSSLVSKEHR